MTPPAPSRVRVGIDLARVSDTETSMRAFGDRYLRRLFTNTEIEDAFAAPALAPQRLTARFAAKEATIKALRPSERWLDWRSIEVRRTPGGWSELALTGDAAALARDAGLVDFSLSMSHEGDYATAIVVAMGAPAPAPTTTPSTTVP